MVYILRCKVGDQVRTKIGMTKANCRHNLDRRMSNIRTGSPYPIEYVALFPNQGAYLEKDLHRKLSDKRIKYNVNGKLRSTEWFEVSPETVLSLIGAVQIISVGENGWLELDKL